MGQKNNVMLEYLKDSRRFADVFNGYFGGGEQIIDAGYLRDVSEKLNGSIAKNPKTGAVCIFGRNSVNCTGLWQGKMIK